MKTITLYVNLYKSIKNKRMLSAQNVRGFNGAGETLWNMTMFPSLFTSDSSQLALATRPEFSFTLAHLRHRPTPAWGPPPTHAGRTIQPAYPIDGPVYSCTTDATAMTTILSVSGDTSAQRTQDNLQPPPVCPHQRKLKSQASHIPATQFLVAKKENQKLERWLTSEEHLVFFQMTHSGQFRTVTVVLRQSDTLLLTSMGTYTFGIQTHM